jgi:hypothetical protein
MTKRSSRTIGFERLEHRCLLAAALSTHNFESNVPFSRSVDDHHDSRSGMEPPPHIALRPDGIGGRMGGRGLPLDKPDRESLSAPMQGNAHDSLNIILVMPVAETPARIVFVSQRAPQREIQRLSVSAFATPTNSLPLAVPSVRTAQSDVLVKNNVIEHETNSVVVGKPVSERLPADDLHDTGATVTIPLVGSAIANARLIAPEPASYPNFSDSLRIAAAMDAVDAFPGNAMEVLEWNPLVTNASAANAVLSLHDDATDRLQTLESLMQQIAESRNQRTTSPSVPHGHTRPEEATHSVTQAWIEQAWLEQASQMVVINNTSPLSLDLHTSFEAVVSSTQPVNNNHWTRGIGLFRPVQSIDGKLASGPSWLAWLNPIGPAQSTSEANNGDSPRIPWLSRSTAMVLGTLLGIASIRFSQRRVHNQTQLSVQQRRSRLHD